MLVPGRSIAHADVQQIQFGIVGHRIPNGSAAPDFPPRTTAPGFGGHLQGIVFKTVGRIPRDGVETPFLLTGLDVVGRDIAAHTEFSAAIADDDVALDDAGCAGDGVGSGLVDGHDIPDDLARNGIECNQPPVDRPDVNLAVPDRHTAVDDITAGILATRLVDIEVVAPQQGPVTGINGVHLAPRAGDVHDAVDHDGGRLETAVGPGLPCPGQAQVGHGLIIDLLQWAIAIFAIGPAMKHPVARFFFGVDQPLCGHPSQ